MRIEICGGIAAGKTTLAKSFKQLGYDCIFEDFSSVPFLDDFYSDPETFSFETELSFLLQHMHQIKKRIITQPFFACDYSLEQDCAYAKNNLTISECAVFMNVYQEIRKHIGYPDIVVFLKCDPSLMLQRISMRGRSNEQTISLGYLVETTDWLEQHLSGVQIPVVELDTSYSDFRNIKKVEERVIPLLQQVYENRCKKD